MLHYLHKMLCIKQFQLQSCLQGYLSYHKDFFSLNQKLSGNHEYCISIIREYNNGSLI
jgi:hypothetical protein